MAGIYIHIPYCKQACNYCNFHFSTSLGSTEAMIHAIQKEIAQRKNYLDVPIETIYFGGGTPSILGSAHLKELMESIRVNFDLEVKEVTIECNPDDITLDKLKSWQDIGINRLSIGIQSFFESHLVWMNRSHNSDQGIASIELALERGFQNITIDLIYGFAQLSDEQLLSNLETFSSFGIPHLSAYALTIEQKTPLQHQFDKKKYLPATEAAVIHQMRMIIEYLEKDNYEHYEISNFAKTGMRALHNTNYWNNVPYAGFGPGAHSYAGHARQWNVSHNPNYIRATDQDESIAQIEVLSKSDQYNEYLMVKLRTIEGVDLDFMEKTFPTYVDSFKEKIISFEGKYITKGGNNYALTIDGKFIADYITKELFAG